MSVRGSTRTCACARVCERGPGGEEGEGDIGEVRMWENQGYFFVYLERTFETPHKKVCPQFPQVTEQKSVSFLVIFHFIARKKWHLLRSLLGISRK